MNVRSRDMPRSLLAALLLAAGCASAEPQAPPAREPPGPARARADSGSAIADRKPVVVGRTLIYPIRHERAEDVAATLLPILQSRFGPNARIVPHLATNSLFIYVPPRREVEQSLRSGAPGGTLPASVARPGGPASPAGPASTGRAARGRAARTAPLAR